MLKKYLFMSEPYYVKLSTSGIGRARCETFKNTLFSCSVKKKLTLEKTVDQIKSEYLAQYGSQFDAIMKAEGFNLVAYIVPFVLLAIFGGISVVVLKKQKAVQIVTQPAGSTNLDGLEEEIQQYRQQR